MKLFDLYTRVTCTKLNILTCVVFFRFFSCIVSFCLQCLVACARTLIVATIIHLSDLILHFLYVFLSFFLSFRMSMSCGHFVCVIPNSLVVTLCRSFVSSIAIRLFENDDVRPITFETCKAQSTQNNRSLSPNVHPFKFYFSFLRFFFAFVEVKNCRYECVRHYAW